MGEHKATWVLVVLPSTTLIGLFQTFWVRKEVVLHLQNTPDDGVYIWTDLDSNHRQQVKFVSRKYTYYGETHTRIWYKLRLAEGQLANRLIGGHSEGWHKKRFREWGFRTFEAGICLMPLVTQSK
jgi:hypothetical protein